MQVGAIFSLNVLSQVSNTSKDVIEVRIIIPPPTHTPHTPHTPQMWSPTPSVFSFLSSLLTTLSPSLASEYPTVHYALLFALFQDSRRLAPITHIPCSLSVCSNHYYLPRGGETSSTIGVASRSPSSSTGSVVDIITLLTQQMHTHKLPFDVW